MKILIADDSSVSRHLLGSMVKKWGYDVVSVSDGTRAWEVLNGSDAPRLAILDWMMPGLTGPQVCESVRAKNSESYTYILLLTGRTQKEDVIEGMTAGADDYVVKPFDQQELRVRLRAGRRIVELQDELLCAREELRQRATHDALTGLKNRACIRQILAERYEEARRSGTPLGLVALDLDRFKLVNDTYGHAAGDALLIAASQSIQNALGPTDVVGRDGGEEFLVVSSRPPDSLAALAESIRGAVAAEPVALGDLQLPVTASLGCASLHPGADLNRLLRAADEALYAAKRNGRNRVETASAGF
jgi:two-component system cell cycle response regulator